MLGKEACLAAADDSTSQQKAYRAAAAERFQAPDRTHKCPECITCWEAVATCACAWGCRAAQGCFIPVCRRDVLSRLTVEGVLQVHVM